MRFEARERERMLRKMSSQKRLSWFTAILCAFCAASCIASPIDELPIPPDARDIHRQSFTDAKSRELSYRIERPYPQESPTAEQSKMLAVQGWTRCSGATVGWDSFVDASRGSGHERTVFQNVSYWSRGDALLMIAALYYGKVDPSGRPVSTPGNSAEFVAISEDHNPAVREKLKLTCTK
jgi:hypothetical protein